MCKSVFHIGAYFRRPLVVSAAAIEPDVVLGPDQANEIADKSVRSDTEAAAAAAGIRLMRTPKPHHRYVYGRHARTGLA